MGCLSIRMVTFFAKTFNAGLPVQREYNVLGFKVPRDFTWFPIDTASTVQ